MMYYWWSWNWYTLREGLLPFLLIFTVIYAVLQRSKVLGTDRKNFNVIVALVIALLIIIPHMTGTYLPEQDPVRIINDAIPYVSVFIILILMFILLVGVWGVEIDWAGGTVTGWIALISFIVVVLIFGSAAHLWWYPFPNWLWWLSDPNTQALILIILVFAILVWIITREPRTTKEGGFFRNLGSFLKKVK